MSKAAEARLFVAAGLPGWVREELAGWARAELGAGGPRLLAPGSLHLTLCFIGSRPQAAVTTIAGLVLGCAMPVGDLGLGPPIWLPPRRPRSLGVEVRDPLGALAELREAVIEALIAGAGLEPERRRFRPHVTVARMGARSPAPSDRALAPTPALSFLAESLILYRSHLEPAGARYEALASVALA